MRIVHFCYVVGAVLILSVMLIAACSDSNIEDVWVFSLVGLLFVLLGMVQHLVALNRKYHEIEMEQEAYIFYKAHHTFVNT